MKYYIVALYSNIVLICLSRPNLLHQCTLYIYYTPHVRVFESYIYIYVERSAVMVNHIYYVFTEFYNKTYLKYYILYSDLWIKIIDRVKHCRQFFSHSFKFRSHTNLN